MENYICSTCGTQYAKSSTPPDQCLICADERQYINPDGQQWDTLKKMQPDHKNVIKLLEPGLVGIGTAPQFAIGQRALLVQTAVGNILWDCISFIDDATVEAVQALGGIAAIAISHPHFYSGMVEWSRAFDNAPIYLAAADQPWVMRNDPAILFWEGKRHTLLDGITLIRCGGHFKGSAVLHWANGADDEGVLLTGDTIHVAADRRYTTFMRSYPNLIPLSKAAVQKIANAVEPFQFNRLYGGWFGSVINSNAKATVKQSAARYIRAIDGQ